MLHGTVKIHKANSPLRQIISQINTPTYHLTKSLNELITPYLPTKYSVKFTHELIQILQTQKPNTKIATSLDVESLLTNVLVKETIDIIINNIYNIPSFPILKINPNILHKLLLICTSKVPFYNHNGDRYIYIKIYSISMGSVLGLTFSNFYVSNLENKIFNDLKKNNTYLCMLCWWYPYSSR